MTLVAVLLLAVLWGAVFVPAMVKARQSASPIATVSMFKRGMQALGMGRSYGGRWVVVPKTPEELAEPRARAVKRRRKFLYAQSSVSIGSLALGLFPGMRELLKLHVTADLFLGAYIFFLLQLKHRNAELELEQQFDGIEDQPEDVAGIEREPQYLHAEHF